MDRLKDANQQVEEDCKPWNEDHDLIVQLLRAELLPSDTERAVAVCHKLAARPDKIGETWLGCAISSWLHVRASAESHDKKVQLSLGDNADWCTLAAQRLRVPIPHIQRWLADFRSANDDETAAFELYWQAAHGGDAEAQFCVGAMLVNGDGVTPNPAQAVPWYTQAAKQGHMKAAFNLADLYELGAEGVTPDLPSAAFWYQRVADRGDVEAQLRLRLTLAKLNRA